MKEDVFDRTAYADIFRRYFIDYGFFPWARARQNLDDFIITPPCYTEGRYHIPVDTFVRRSYAKTTHLKITENGDFVFTGERPDGHYVLSGRIFPEVEVRPCKCAYPIGLRTAAGEFEGLFPWKTVTSKGQLINDGRVLATKPDGLPVGPHLGGTGFTVLRVGMVEPGLFLLNKAMDQTVGYVVVRPSK